MFDHCWWDSGIATAIGIQLLVHFGHWFYMLALSAGGWFYVLDYWTLLAFYVLVCKAHRGVHHSPTVEHHYYHYHHHSLCFLYPPLEYEPVWLTTLTCRCCYGTLTTNVMPHAQEPTRSVNDKSRWSIIHACICVHASVMQINWYSHSRSEISRQSHLTVWWEGCTFPSLSYSPYLCCCFLPSLPNIIWAGELSHAWLVLLEVMSREDGTPHRIAVSSSVLRTAAIFQQQISSEEESISSYNDTQASNSYTLEIFWLQTNYTGLSYARGASRPHMDLLIKI
jgi:hypothetical protein